MNITKSLKFILRDHHHRFNIDRKYKMCPPHRTLYNIGSEEKKEFKIN